MKSNFQFSLRQNFPATYTENLKPGRHTKHVESAIEEAFCKTDLFVDVHGAEGRKCVAYGVCPCVTDGHVVWSVELGRYLNGEDFLNCQGLWKTAFSEQTYTKLVHDDPFAQSLAGNSFTSTVVQAVLLSAFVCTSNWDTLCEHLGNDAGDQVSVPPSDLLRRIRGKRKAPEFESFRTEEPEPMGKKGKGKTRKRKYKRKVEGSDSRKDSKGKHTMASIYDKEMLRGPQRQRRYMYIYIYIAIYPDW